MSQNLTEKIISSFCLSDKPVQSGDYIFIMPRYVMTHDNSAAVIKKFEKLERTSVYNTQQIVFTLDHDIQNKSNKNISKYAHIEDFSKKHNIAFFPAGRGIGHQVMCEEGYVWPGTLVVASDSHSNMYGGLGCLGTPITRTDAAVIWATGKTWWQIPPVAKVELCGKLRKGVTGKDIIVALCGYFCEDQVLNHAIEFTGKGISCLSIEDRLTIANMTTEWGALSGLFPTDQKTLYWFDHYFSRTHQKYQIIEPLYPDLDSHYDKILTIDLDSISPCVSGPNTVKKMISMHEIAKQKIKINKAYLLSCVNGRTEDLAAAAKILDNKKVANNVRLYIAAASSKVQGESEQRGDWQKLLDAGAIALPSGCGPCIGLGKGILQDGEVGISATNRNFKGRMGSTKADVYLGSPLVVAYSAHKGYIDFPDKWTKKIVAQEKCNMRNTDIKHEILPCFSQKIISSAIFCCQDNINTDGIYPGKYTYDETITCDKQALVVMENYDKQFQKIAREGDILVAGFNFGTGSSREQAATALKFKKICAVIAGSLNATYKRNALNNGLMVLQSPDLVKYLQKIYCDLTNRLEHQISIDLATTTITYQQQIFACEPLGIVAQQLLESHGIENWIQKEK